MEIIKSQVLASSSTHSEAWQKKNFQKLHLLKVSWHKKDILCDFLVKQNRTRTTMKNPF